MIGRKQLAASSVIMWCGAVAMSCVSPMLAAQEAPEAGGHAALALEEVVVTARRREESLQDIPVSMTVFSAEDLERGNIDDVKDYFMKTPNVSFTEAGTRGERDISIRGVSNIGGQVSALAFYVDEFNIINGPQTANTGNTNSSINPQLIDVERVEVLRGPQGTYFGRNATGGAVNITTRKPTNEFYGEVSGGYGYLDTWHAAGIVNLPITDKLYFRGSAQYESSDGYVRNVAPEGGRSDTESRSFRAALRFVPNDDIVADLVVNYTKDEQGLPELVPNGMLSESSAGLAAAAGFPGGANEAGFYPDNFRNASYDLVERLSNEYMTLVGRIEIDLGWSTLTSVTGYLDTEFRSLDNDLDGTSFGFLDQDREVWTDSFSQEIRLSGSAGAADSFEWVVGAIYAEDDKTQQFSVTAGADGFLGLPTGFPIDTGDIDFNTESWAVFGEVTWTLNDRWTIAAGGRYTEDDVSQRAEGINFGAPDVPGEGDVSFSDFSPRLTATFAANENVNIYGTVSKGYKAGGLQLNVTQQLPVIDFQEETIWNYEAGIKLSAWEGRLQSNLSVFYMQWDDMQVTSNTPVLDPETNEITFLNITQNATGATNKGVEFDFRALPTEHFEIGAAVGYLDADFDDFDNAFVLGQVVDLSGEPIPRAPEWTASADAELRGPMSRFGDAFADLGEGYVRVEWSYRSKSVPVLESLVPNPQQIVADAFDLVNLRLGVVNDRYRVSAFVENLLDEEYFTNFHGFGFAGARINPTYRTYGVKFNAYFR